MKFLKFLKLAKSSLTYPVFTWEYLLATLILAILTSRLIAHLYSIFIPQKYPQLTVGAITWSAGSKTPDYLVLFGFLICFFTLFCGLRVFVAFIREKSGEILEPRFRKLLVYCSIPVGMWAGTTFRINTLYPDFIVISSVLILFTILLTSILLSKEAASSFSNEYIDLIGAGLLSILLSTLNGSSILIAYNRLTYAQYLPFNAVNSLNTAISINSAFTMFFLLALFVLWLRQKDLVLLKRGTRILLCFSQLAIPLAFFILIPTPWIQTDRKFYGYGISNNLWILVGVLIIISLIDISKRIWKSVKSDKIGSIFLAISPPCMIAILLFLKSPVVGASYISPDDYHWGENLLGYWLWKHHGYIPYQDYDPARGLVNYVPGFLADLFLNENAISYTAVIGGPILILPFIGIGYLVVSQTIGLLPAFLALLFMPNPGVLFEIDIVATIALCICAKFFLNKHWIAFLIAWFSSCCLLIIFGPGQGGLFSISTLPLAGFALYKAIRQHHRRLIYTVIFLAIISVVLGLFTPLDNILFGALRYGVEQSSVNSVAYGIEWFQSQGRPTVLTYPLFELIRTSWIVASVLIGLLIYRSLIRREFSEDRKFLVFAIPVFLLTVLLIPRSAGRIDPSGMSRLGNTSLWVGCLLLPIVLMQWCKNFEKATVLLMIAILGGVLSAPSEIHGSLFYKPIAIVDVAGLSFLDGKATGLPKLNGGILDPYHLQRLQKVNTILKSLLKSDETYLDLTNYHAQYFYFDYPSPIQSGAPYNLVHPNQQVRALELLKKNSPPLILVRAESGNMDAGSLALRPHLIYRYILDQGYIPFSVDQYIFLIQAQLINRLNNFDTSQLNGEVPSTLLIGNTRSNQFSLLDQAFFTPDLGMIPSAWGKSIQSLQGQVRHVADISSQIKPILRSFVHRGKDKYRIAGSIPALIYDISSLNLSGRDAGLLVFKFEACRREPKTKLNIRWEDALTRKDDAPMSVSFTVDNGWQIVPLDATPRWLLADRLKKIQIEVPSSVCARFSISDVKLFQRSEVAEGIVPALR